MMKWDGWRMAIVHKLDSVILGKDVSMLRRPFQEMFEE